MVDPVVVRLFSVLRERAGAERVHLDAADVRSAADVTEAVFARYPQLDPFRRYVRVAVNQVYADPRTRVEPGDEVALITPVSGG